MAGYAAYHLEVIAAGAGDTERMARYLLFRSSGLPVGREGPSENKRCPQRGYNGFYQKGPTGRYWIGVLLHRLLVPFVHSHNNLLRRTAIHLFK